MNTGAATSHSNKYIKQQITCPKCSSTFALDEAFNRALELHLREKLNVEFAQKETELRAHLDAEIASRSDRERADLQVRIETQSKELLETRENERKLLQAQAELKDKAERAELEAQRKLAEDRDKIRKTAQQQVIDEHQLRDAEKNKQLGDLRRQIEDLKQKAEQGSQQLQGDVQELELEKSLRKHFPKDDIQAVKAGARGADIVQKVVSDDGNVCGTILWESKRVRNWSDSFVDKLLRDKNDAKADLGVIVTNALPQHVIHMGCVKGVLLTTFNLAVCLAATLRVNMALLAHTRLALGGQDNDKTQLYEYFMSPQFHGKMTLIADQLNQMQDDLSREKAAITRTWGKRQQQLETVMASTAGLAGTLQSFYGTALGPMPQFELPAVDEG